MKFKSLADIRSGITTKLRCFVGKHELSFKRNVYGDEIIITNSRSLWVCNHCNRLVRKHELQKEPQVQKYSHDYLNKLSEEHKLITDSIHKLRSDVHFNREYGAITVQGAINNLMLKRIELEAQMEVISEHLN